MNCPQCKATLSYNPGERLNRSDQCHQCSADLKICILCEFYEKGAQWDCREHISEAVLEKEKANFCDFFRLAKQSNSEDNDPNQNLKSAAEALFKT